MTGVVKTIFDSLEKFATNIAEKWLQKGSVARELQHGGCFTGNSARKLLRSADMLRSMSEISTLPYVRAFHALNSVVISCFGYHFDSKLRDSIREIKRSFDDLQIRYTPKIHALVHRVSASRLFHYVKQL